MRIPGFATSKRKGGGNFPAAHLFLRVRFHTNVTPNDFERASFLTSQGGKSFRKFAMVAPVSPSAARWHMRDSIHHDERHSQNFSRGM